MATNTATGQNNGTGGDDDNGVKKRLEKCLSDLEFNVESLSEKLEDLNASFQKFTHQFQSNHSVMLHELELFKEEAAMLDAEIRKKFSS